jgi:hypothetical protein
VPPKTTAGDAAYWGSVRMSVTWTVRCMSTASPATVPRPGTNECCRTKASLSGDAAKLAFTR